jgi:predicted phage tail protein
MRKSAAELIRRASFVALATATAAVMTGCGGGDGGGSSGGSATGAANPPSVPGPASNTAPTISAAPATAATVGAAYDLAPSAQDADGDALAFSIQNRPEWATFSTATGRLSGTPQVAGTATNVVISVSDGKTSVALPAFTITVAAAGSPPVVSGKGVQLSWDVPTRTIDGETLSDLSGYRIHYGKTANALTEAIEIRSAGANTYAVQQLKPGTYYFAVRAITADGNESALSNVISRVIS